MSTLTLAAVFAALVDAALKGSLVLLAALAATRLMKRRSAAARHLVWVVALASMLALPLVSRALPAWRVVPVPAPLAPAAGFVAAPEPAAPPAAVQPRAAGLAGAASTSATDASKSSRSIAPNLPTPAAPSSFDWKTALMALWIAGGALLVARLAYGLVRVWWMERRAVEITDEGWVRITDALARRLRVGRMVTLLREAHAVVPMTWGIVRPVVLLPADAEAWDGERRTVVLAHELAHVRRWDTATQWVAHLALAVFWFNPLVWMAARRMREEREHACDDAVLSIGTVPVQYADHLLEIVRSLGAVEGPAAALAMARRSQFEGRLLAILDGATPRGGVSRGLGFAALVVAAAAVLPLGALRARPAQALPAHEAEAASVADAPAGKHPLASIAAKMERIVDRAVDALPMRDSAVKTALRIPTTPRPAGSASGAAAAAAAAPSANGLSPAPPNPPNPPAPSASIPSGAELTAAIAGALGVAPAQAKAMLQDGGGYGDVIRAAAGIASAPDRASVLIAVLRRPDVGARDLADLLRVAGGIASNAYRRDVLTEAARRYSLSPAAVRAAFFSATAGFTGCPERRDVLMAVLARTTDAQVVDAVVEATRGMTTDPERRDVLLKAVDRASSPELLNRIVDASRGLSTSPVRRDVLLKVLARPGLPSAVQREVFSATSGIATSPERRDVLVYAAAHQRLDAAAREAYLNAANGIASSPERTEALTALLGARGAATAPPATSARASSVTTTTHIHNDEDNGVWNSEIQLTDDGGRAVRVVARQVVRGGAADDIRSIRRGGSLMVEETLRGQTRRVDMAPAAGGGISRGYKVNGQARPFDADAERWFGGILREFTRK